MMTRLSERAQRVGVVASVLRRSRRPALMATLVAAVVLVVAVGLFTAHQLGAFARGPAVDTTSTYLRAIQRQDYPSAYALLASDLRAEESETTFAASMRRIDTADGAISDFSVRDEHSGDGVVVVTVEVSRSSRGTFTLRVQLRQDGSGQWRVTGSDDL